ncbi:MAG: hypothetical protein NZO58_09425 [Gemmataceae bacterium]|nr:hypothetical protein [Gemmataceae bacterium]
MIVMPRRSVTRFFIPLIDVLLLLFVIFLLMPIANLEELEERGQVVSELAETVDSLERELTRRTREMRLLEEARPGADEIVRLRSELNKLQQAARQPLHQRVAIHVIDVDGKTGAISYYDASQPERPIIKLESEKAVAELIRRHQAEAGERELYYLFLMPRPETDFPTRRQERDYRAWFGKVGHSLQEAP